MEMEIEYGNKDGGGDERDRDVSDIEKVIGS